jgi:predicted  nucleic acid-binding Zn-ribbon protein
MDIVARLLLREEIDALGHELSTAKRASNPDFSRIQDLKREVERLEDRYAAARRSEIERRFAG